MLEHNRTACLTNRKAGIRRSGKRVRAAAAATSDEPQPATHSAGGMNERPLRLRNSWWFVVEKN